MINQAVTADDRPQASSYPAGSQVLLLSACPLTGPIQGLTAWAGAGSGDPTPW